MVSCAGLPSGRPFLSSVVSTLYSSPPLPDSGSYLKLTMVIIMGDVIEFPAKSPSKTHDGLTHRLEDFIENPTMDISDMSGEMQKLMRILASELKGMKGAGEEGGS